MTVLEVLQLCLIGKRSGKIDCVRDGTPGTIHVDGGRVTHARYGELSGEPAFYALVAARQIECQFEPDAQSAERSVDASTDFLLMEAARRADEHRQTQAVPAKLLGDSSGRLNVTQLTVISEALPKVFELNGPRVRIGRALDNEIILPVESVSGHHCELVLGGREYRIQDVGSRNGTYVNNQRITEATPLRPGDLLQLGAALLRCGAGEITPALIKRKTARIHDSETQRLDLPSQQAARQAPPAMSALPKPAQGS